MKSAYLKDHSLKGRERIKGDNTEGRQVGDCCQKMTVALGDGREAEEKWLPYQDDYEVELIGFGN